MKWNKDDTYGLIGTLAFHAALFLVLWFTVIRAAIPEEDGGVLVNFGNIDSAAGTFEPQYTGQVLPEETTTPPPPTPVPPVETPQEDLITQDMEESVSLDDKRKEEEQKRKAEEERKRKEAEEQERIRQEKEAEAKRLAEEQNKKRIENLVSGALGIGKGDSNNQGDAKVGSGNQGRLTGNSDHGAMEGFGGNGKYDYSLEGRKFVGEVRLPSDLETEEGKIVVDIIVDPRGNVIGASVGKGTTIDNAIMRREAISAAKKNRFNSIEDSNNQYGTITFIYKIK